MTVELETDRSLTSWAGRRLCRRTTVESIEAYGKFVECLTKLMHRGRQSAENRCYLLSFAGEPVQFVKDPVDLMLPQWRHCGRSFGRLHSHSSMPTRTNARSGAVKSEAARY